MGRLVSPHKTLTGAFLFETAVTDARKTGSEGFALSVEGCGLVTGQFAHGTEKSFPTVTPDPDLESI